MVTTMRASSPADLVAAAVAMLQVVPTSSLCVLPTERDRQGGDARVPGAMRWPVPVAEVAVGDMAGSVGYTVARFGVRRAVAVVFGTQEQARLSARVLAAVADVLEVPVVVSTDGQVCRVLNLRTGRCEPAEGVPVRLGAHRFIAEMAWAGVVALSSEEQLRADYTPMDAEPEPGTFTDSAVWSQFGNPERVGVGFDSAQRVIAQRLADPSTFTDGDVQLLAAAAHSLLVRDLLWCEITERTAREYQELWRRVAVRCPAVLAAPALALSGFAAWLTGSGVVARVAIEQAAVCDPTHRMTQLVSQMLQGGLSPQVWLQTHAQTRTHLHADLLDGQQRTEHRPVKAR